MYALLGAPDLAMTQFAVETLTVVIFVLVFSRLRGFADLSSRFVRVRDACVALAAGTLVTTLVLFIGASGTTSSRPSWPELRQRCCPSRALATCSSKRTLPDRSGSLSSRSVG